MIDHIIAHVLPAAFSLLPSAMYSAEAKAMLLTIGLQESRFEHRHQLGGPARGFFQFELAGVRGVLEHSRTRQVMLTVLRDLQYDDQPGADAVAFLALEHNDTLAACFARCLLWTLPGALAGPTEAEAAWRLYLDAWRPGKPHREAWQANYAIGWGAVLKERMPPQELKA